MKEILRNFRINIECFKLIFSFHNVQRTDKYFENSVKFKVFKEVYFLPVFLARTLKRFLTLPHVLHAPTITSPWCYHPDKEIKYLNTQNYKVYASFRTVKHVSDTENGECRRSWTWEMDGKLCSEYILNLHCQLSIVWVINLRKSGW